MTDIAGLIINIPATVKGFVETARVVQSYNNLEQEHKESVKRAVFISELLDYYARLVDTEKLGEIDDESFRLMSRAFTHAIEAHQAAVRVVGEWSEKLGMQVDAESELEKTSQSRRLSLASLITSLAGKLPRSGEKSSDKRTKRPLRKLPTDMNYLAFGRIEIDEAAARMERWINNLNSILLILPMRHLVRSGEQSHSTTHCMGDRAVDVTFVARARDRVRSNIDSRIVDASQLQHAFSIDPTHNCPIQRLKDGPYAGCILDLRDLGLRFQLYDETRDDTDKIFRLFCEEEDETMNKHSASVGILQCCGYIDLLEETMQYLVFRLPPEAGTPRTLRSLLLDCNPRHPLNMRLDFSIQLATSVLIVHSLDLVHKNIRPDSIIVTESVRAAERNKFPYQLGTPYLVAFDQARTEAGPSTLRSYRGAALFESLYQHPRHITSTTRRKYEMRDDIYSLGICLLEVGIWKSLFRWDAEAGGFVGNQNILDLTEKRFEKELEEHGLSTEQDKSWLRQNALVALAESELAVTMGEAFRDVVVDCLTFGNGRSTYEESLAKTHEPKDLVVKNQSVKFIQNVLERLRSLSLS